MRRNIKYLWSDLTGIKCLLFLFNFMEEKNIWDRIDFFLTTHVNESTHQKVQRKRENSANSWIHCASNKETQLNTTMID